MFPKSIPGEEFINSFYPILIALGLGLVLGFRYYMRGPQCPSNELAKKKTVIITGGTNGIGRELAKELAGRGAKVIIGGSNEERGAEAVEEIKKDAKSNNVFYRKLDLASFESVRSFAKAFIDEDLPVHMLINNAGIMMQPMDKTEDGNEIHFQVNYLGHFLLTSMLMKNLKKASPSRVVNMIAPAYRLTDVAKLADPNTVESQSDAYACSKAALLIFTKYLAQHVEASNITVNAALPGIVNTDLYKNMPFKQSKLVSWSMTPVFWFLTKTCRDGAQLPLYLCVSKEEEGVTGKVYKDFQIEKEEEWVIDPQLMAQVMELSMKLTGYKPQDEVKESDEPQEGKKKMKEEEEAAL